MLPKLTVWYNTKCPVCDGGINWQRNRLIAAARAGVIGFRDIDLEPEALVSRGSSLDDVRRRLHGLDEAGCLFVGTDCANEIWRRTPGDSWLARLDSLPLIRPLARFTYDRFADLLFAWSRRKRRWVGWREWQKQMSHDTAWLLRRGSSIPG